MIYSVVNSSMAFSGIIPEIFLVTCIFGQLLFNLYLRKQDFSKHYNLNIIALWQSCLILVCTLVIFFYADSSYVYSNFLLYNTAGTYVLKKLLVFFSILALFPIGLSCYLQKINDFEIFTLFLMSVLACLLLMSAGDFLTVYLLLETLSLCFYVLATFKKGSPLSSEAGLKYFIIGSVMSCIFVFALSMLYGSVGTLNFHDLNLLFFHPFPEAFSGVTYCALFSILLICIVFLFKLGIVPFQFWVPDVYNGAPLAATLIFSYLPKLVFFDILIKLHNIFGFAFKELEFLFVFCGILSVCVGSLFAVSQTSFKRFLIYSSIAQMGFPVILLGIDNEEALSSIYLFVILYVLSSILMWTIYLLLHQFTGRFLSNDEEIRANSLNLSDLSNLYTFDKTWAYTTAFFLFSASGIPPLYGFISKFVIIMDLVINQYTICAIILLFINVISTFYYIRLIKIIFFDKKNVNVNKFNKFETDSFNLSLFNIIVVVACFIILMQSFFFFDAWLLLSNYIYFSSLF